MRRRIIASFLAVLLALLALVVVPLGVSLSTRERHDFVAAADTSARSLAAVAEETLGDRRDATGRVSGLRLPADPGDSVAVIDNNGRTVAAAGSAASAPVIAAVKAGRRPGVRGSVVRVVDVGLPSAPDGHLVLVRGSGPLDRRIRTLWLGLAAAAAISLCLGASVAVGLARWIARPLRDLHAVAARTGHGEESVRVAQPAGAPEVQALAVAFNEMAARIESLLSTQRVMTADVSHQLRTPLAALRLRIELLADDAPESLRVELVDTLGEITRLSRLADGLLAVARANEVEASPEPIEVGEVAQSRVEFWSAVAADRGVALSAQVDRVEALVTPGHLEQVLDNLIANCLDALEPGRSVTVRLTGGGDDVVLAVADDGPGMSQAHRQTAFGRFVGDPAGSGRSGRSGLGLAIVARLVAADHGATELEETPGGGLTAVIRLPAARSAALQSGPGHDPR